MNKLHAIKEMRIDPTQNSELGDFKLIPEEGYKLRSFIDIESNLLVVTESLIDISHLPSNHGMVTVPAERFIIDTKSKLILNPEEWTKYFNYEPIRKLSEDGKFMEVLQRVHEPEKNNDSLKYQLFNLQEDKIVLTGTSVAFSDKPRINSFDIYYESLKNADNYKNSLKLCEYPLDKHLGYLDKLSSEQLIIQYYDSQDVFELKFIHDHFELCKAQIPKGRNEWENLHTSKIMDFESIPEFWLFLTASNWYSRYNLRFKHYSIEKYIIEEHNRIVKERIVPQIEYSKLHNWMNVNYNHDIERNVYWQFCSNCRERVFYNPRYPNHVCNKCVMLIEDNIGNVLDYRTTHELKYIDGRFKVLLKNTDEEVNISIGNVAYYASEAHFGGIVHQLQE